MLEKLRLKLWVMPIIKLKNYYLLKIMGSRFEPPAKFNLKFNENGVPCLVPIKSNRDNNDKYDLKHIKKVNKFISKII